MKSVRVLFVGGFLGAGKTTLLYQAARQLIASGKKVGLITNDQAPELADTRFLQSHKLAVSEVAGSCFCCNFKGLIDAARALREGTADVDVLLAEPVGSCTDLSATIVQPMKDRYGEQYRVGPLSVLVDPARAIEVLSGSSGLLHPSAAYIYRKQIEEADRIVVNKSDLLNTGERKEIESLLHTQFPNREIAFVSCQSGEGIKGWLDDVMMEAESGRRILDLDYDTYAEGEAILGWLNGYFRLTGETIVDWKEFAKRYLMALRDALAKDHAEVGHVKLFLSIATTTLTANLTSSGGTVVCHVHGETTEGKTAEMTLNARVQMAPDALQDKCLDILGQIEDTISVTIVNIRSLRPGRPQPTYRYSETI